MNRPTVHFSYDSLRKVGDSNPRYGNPHGSLANCWFQPLTQPSSRILNRINQASFLNASAKVLLFFGSTKFLCNFLQKILKKHRILISNLATKPLFQDIIPLKSNRLQHFSRFLVSDTYNSINLLKMKYIPSILQQA